MWQFYRSINRLVINGWSWGLDYWYVARHQLLSHVLKSDARRYQRPVTATKPAIIMLPGIYETWHFMKPVIEVLHVSGYSVHVIERLGYNRGSIEEMAAVVTDYITASDVTECIIVAHSKGGLIGKYILLYHNQAVRIMGVVGLTVPFGGSRYARLFPLKAVRMLAPKAAILGALSLDQTFNKNIISIYGLFDPHIPGGSYLVGAANIQLPVRGHFRIMHDRRVHAAVLSSVDRLSKQTQQDEDDSFS